MRGGGFKTRIRGRLKAGRKSKRTHKSVGGDPSELSPREERCRGRQRRSQATRERSNRERHTHHREGQKPGESSSAKGRQNDRERGETP